MGHVFGHPVYIWISYTNSGYIRHYGPGSLLLSCDNIRNRSEVELMSLQEKAFNPVLCMNSVILDFKP